MVGTNGRAELTFSCSSQEAERKDRWPSKSCTQWPRPVRFMSVRTKSVRPGRLPLHRLAATAVISWPTFLHYTDSAHTGHCRITVT